MKMLSKAAFDHARTYIMETARPLEKSLFNHFFQSGPAELCREEIASFQSSNGGYVALEPDFAGEVTTVLNATLALETLIDLKTPSDHPLIGSTMRHLSDTYDLKLNAWPILPKHDNTAPHAPWWHYDEDFDAQWKYFIDNPRPKILSFTYRYPGYIKKPIQQRVYESTLERIAEMPEGEISRDSFECYLALFSCSETPKPLRDALGDAIGVWIEEIMEQDKEKWGGYCLKPIDAIHSPQSPFYQHHSAIVDANLDYEIDTQMSDGSWDPNWDWAGTYPQEWEIAKRRWKGVLTLKNLQILKSFGRVEDG